MDFNKIFDTYSNDIDTPERSNEFAEIPPMPANILQKVKTFIQNFDSNKEPDNSVDDITTNTDPITEETSASSVPDNILDVLTQLDKPLDLSFDNPPEDINIENSIDDDTDFDNPLDNDDTDFDNPLDNDDTDFDNPLDNDDTDFDNPLDNDDTDFDEDMFDEETENNTFNEEISTDILDDTNEFDIELPEEFSEQNIESEQEKIEETEIDDFSFTTPDFLETELNNSSLEIPTHSLEAPTDYEVLDKSVDFNIWDKQKKDLNTDLVLTQEQIFAIRYKINSFIDKDLRFKIREIIADPEAYNDIYKKLISLLLIDAPEDTIAALLVQLNNSDSTDIYQLSEKQTLKASFQANDVADYQDTMYRLKTEFIYNIKKYTLYGLILLLTGIITWFGLAQPMRVNSIFKKGLAEVQKDNFVEGEALFQQANAIAGKPIAEWFMKYGDVYNTKGLIAEAERKHLAAIAIEPQNITIATNASSFYTNLGPKYFTNAITIMKKLAPFHPNKFEVWDVLGSLFINYSDYFIDNKNKQTELLYEAADVYQQYILNNSKDPAPYYRMIDIYIRIGNKEQIDLISQLITKLNPKYINLYIMNQLAKYYTDQRDLTKSEQILRQISPMLDQYYNKVPSLQKIMNKYYNINPTEISNIVSTSYFEFARYKMLSYDVKGAGELLTNSIAFNSIHGESYNLLGELYLYSPSHDSDKLTQAKKMFDKALNINPEDFKAHINLGHMYYMWDNEFGDMKKAHSTATYHYRIAKAMMPSSTKNTLLSYNYGWLEYQNDNPKEAIDSWSDIYKETPNNPVLAYALGSALYKTGNPQLAQIELTKAANTFKSLKDNIPQPELNNKRHKEVYTQLAKTYNNIGVINANYASVNRNQADYFDSQALLNFYNAQDISDQINSIYSTAEYNIGVITRPNIRNRKTIFDDAIPKQTSIENSKSEFNKLLLQNI